MFTPNRLRIARQRHLLSMQRLSEKSGISARSLTEYEKGRKTPSDDSLAKLAAALAVDVSFFLLEEPELVTVDSASFRKLSKTSASHRDAALATASLGIDFFRIIDERFSLPQNSIPSFDTHTPQSAAELVRSTWALGDRPIGNLLHLLESKGARVAGLQKEISDIDAFCFSLDGSPYIFLNTGKTAERQRFDLAHELGHIVLHQDDTHPDSKVLEQQANTFASNFLMPETSVRALAKNPSLEWVMRGKAYWNVSAMALAHRLHELELLSEWQYRAMCMELTKMGYRKSEPGGANAETSQLLKKVIYGTEHRISLRDFSDVMKVSVTDIKAQLLGLLPMVAP